MTQTLQADDGYFFGLGAFETIAVEKGRPVFLEEHLTRLTAALNQLEIPLPLSENTLKQKLRQEAATCPYPHGVLKVTVSSQNLLVTFRENPYTPEHYSQGFTLAKSAVHRNETSPFTYIKSIGCPDNIFEKRRHLELNCDEPVFLNTHNALTEGATSNLFFCRGDQIFTPPITCGLLNGILRDWVKKQRPVTEKIITLEDLSQFDGLFITNSLLGIMPVTRFDDHYFDSRVVADALRGDYLEFLKTF